MPDLYAELGIDKGATPAAIKAAYRRRSKKAHPDGGGSPEKFGALNTAYRVLSDDAKRAKYDATGEIDEGNPDNSQQRAWNIIASLLEGVLMGDGDPTTVDLVAAMRGTIDKLIADIEKRKTQIERASQRIEKIATRFKVKNGRNMIAVMLKSRLAQADQAMRNAVILLEDHRAARKILGDYTFDFDRPMPPAMANQFRNFQFYQTGSF